MNPDDKQEGLEIKNAGKRVVFVRGFLLRFVLGMVPIGLIALIRADLRSIMLLAVAWFLIVCIIAASMDVALKRSVRFDVRRLRLTPRIVVSLILILGSLAWIILSR